MTFQFNPKEVTITKAAKWERKPTKGSKKAGPPEFTGPEPCKLTLEMFFDATAAQDGVGGQGGGAVAVLLRADPREREDQEAEPAVGGAALGQDPSFPAFVTSVSAKYTLFTANGTPIRALCSVAMEEMPGEPFRQNPTSGGEHVRRVHRTVAGDTLASLAYAEYGDPAQWRALAAYNGIDDPLRVPAAAPRCCCPPAERAG